MSKKVPHQSTVGGMAIRLPKKVVETLQELKKEESLPSMAAALQAWLQQQVQDRTDIRLSNLEQVLKELEKRVKEGFLGIRVVFAEQQKINHVLCAGFHLMPDSKMTPHFKKYLRKVMINCGEDSCCFVKDPLIGEDSEKQD